MASQVVDGVMDKKEDEGGGIKHSQDVEQQQQQQQPRITNVSDADYTYESHDLQALDVFIKHVTQQQQQQRARRPSLPNEGTELSTLTGVVMRRKQQLQLKYQQQVADNDKKHLSPTNYSKGRPLSISSVSSAASSNSSSSANSSASSGVQSSLTRNGSLNYGHEYRKYAYLASIESLNNPNSSRETLPIESGMKALNLSQAERSKDSAATRAAVLAAGAQSRGFLSPGNGTPKINRSLHASLRYDRNTAYRIHLMASARVQTNTQADSDCKISKDEDIGQQRRGGLVSRNNSSTSSDSGHHQPANKSRFVCSCGSTQAISSSSSASQVDQATTSNEKESSAILDSSIKAATIDSGSCQRSIQHHPDCSYSRIRPKRGSAKLQTSPSSVSSHSNNSSLFRDDGFEDDFASTASEHMSSTTTYQHHHHRLSFQSRSSQSHRYRQLHSRRAEDDEDEYQSCEEEFSNSHTTASTASNIDDCALSTTSSSIMHHEQQVLDQISLANAKQQYRKSLLLEHQQQQHLLNSQTQSQTRIQSLISTSPKLPHLGLLSQNTNANTNATSNNGCVSPTKQSKCDDRTVNIIGHMPTKSPGYWDSNLSIAQRVVTEIIETERTYVDDLEQIVTGYICYLRNVLKQQKHQQKRQYHSQVSESGLLSNNRTASDDDEKSMFALIDDTTSATNEVEDYDVEEVENDLGIKENILSNIELSSADKSNTSEGAIMTATHIKKLFSNLEDIYKFNKDLLFRLEECYLNPSSVAECFVENASGFEIYTHYCTMYPQVVSTLTELMSNQTSAQLLRERQNDLNQSLPLGAYLLKPVQRILKYHILFQSLIKHTTDDETVGVKDRQLINEAFSVMTNIACHINSMKKRHEHAIRVQEVQGLLSGWEGPDLTTLGELILEDTFKLYNRPRSSRHLFLFDNVLLITKKKRDGSLCYKGHIACSNLMLIEKIDGQPLVFNIVPFDSPKSLYAFQAKNLDKKRDWCIQMKEVIIKSFEVEIPVQARDILMSLTNSSATQESTKSSSETARAMRAPNYLEKKRAKLDNKKK